MARLLGIDVGTTGTKALLIDENGKVLKSAHAEYRLSTPKPGWAEQDPEDWWRATLSCLAEIGERPDAIGLTGQMHGSVFLDSADRVLRPALLWCDQRTGTECGEIDRLCGAEFVRVTTCNPPLTGFQLPKVLWLRNNEPEKYRELARVLLPKDFIGFRLTGAYSTDFSDASGVGALDVGKRQWSDDVLARVGVERSLFPEPHESWDVVGTTKEGVPVVAGAGDQAAGAVGVGAVQPGIVSLSLGTSGVAFTNVIKAVPDPNGSAHVFCHANGGWHAMGVMLSCGGAVRWARDVLFPGGSYDDMAIEAAKVSVGCERLTFLPYLAGERCPHVDPSARGAFAGLALSHSRGHLARAVFEGVTFGMAECLETLRDLGGRSERLRVTGGGAKSAFWLQLMADVTRTECVTMAVDEGPAFGAALLAGVGVSVWPDVESATRSAVRELRSVHPGPSDFDEAYKRYKALYPALKDWVGADNTIK